MSDSSQYEGRIASILEIMGISPTDLDKRKSYLEIQRSDLDALLSLRAALAPVHQELMDAFYNHLQEFHETRSLLPTDSKRKQLLEQQDRYFTELLSGKYDWEFLVSRLRVGIVHEVIGLEPRWYIGSYCKFLNLLIDKIITSVNDDAQQLSDALQAIIKVAFLDIGLVLDTYSAADRNSILNLKEHAESNMRMLTMALEQSADAVMITDAGGIIQYVNHGFVQTTGYNAAEAIGKSPAILKSGMQGNGFYQTLWSTILNGKVFREILVNRRKSSELYYEEKTITPLKNAQGSITHFISTGRDITDRMRTQERLQYMAQHDFLTSLPNRILFMDRVERAIFSAERHQKLIAVMFMDLDRFKQINDTLGHHIGDSMLVTLAKRLQSALREGDTIARWSGDEFAILLQDIKESDDIPKIITKLFDQFRQPFQIESHQLFITSSIGIAMYPTDGNDAISLVKNADTAMYNAKKRGRGTFSFYAPQMNAMAEEQLYIENELRQALARSQFSLLYQPQVQVINHQFTGVEALLRWHHPERGMIEPEIFIHMLEDMGLIIPIGSWVIQQACQQLRHWLDAGINVPHIAVNISPRQLFDEGFVTTVLNAIDSAGLEPHQLELEITENSLLQEEQVTIAKLKLLHEHGIKIAVDDFGTGYCSLSYLKYLPVSTLKIDRSFLKQCHENQQSIKLINAIIAMGQSLNMEVIAEGVETEQDYSYIRSTLCNTMQGFYISHPMESEMLQAFIAKKPML